MENFIYIPDSDWEQISDLEGDPSARLLATIKINGLYMHLEAIAVTTNDDGIHEAVDPCREDDLAALENAEDTAFRTIEIMGREYVIYATPFGR